MLRDLKIFRRNLGKKPNAEEIENVPASATDCTVIQTGEDPNRAPLNTIPEPSQIPKSVPEQEFGTRSKLDRTPSKVQGKGGNGSSAFRTPEKQRNKFGWAQKNELGASVTETRDDGRDEINHLPPSSRGLGNGGLANMTPRSSRTVGRTMSNHSECGSTQSTPTKSVTKPPNPGFGLVNSSRPPVNLGPRAGNFAALSKGIPTTCSAASIVNTVEVPHFELREDPSFWMDHNVQVVIRVRPLNSTERCSNGYSRCLKQESAQTLAWIGQPETRFTFDHVACETVTQEMLFRVAGLPIVENCLSGYNSCMFAYGQTGSGKTHTMLGEIDELEVKPSPHRGMTPRIFEFLFARIRAEEESRRDEKLKYNCKCSFLEIYNEQITDLLDPSSSNLLLREDIKNGVYVENLTESEVQTVNDILKLLTEGAANRRVAATNMNRESSRSHSVFTCVIESRWEKDNTTNLRFARLNLVDLAGSERQKTSGAEGERLKEAANINKSLSTLGHVIMLLVDVAHGKQRHIPYRDSKLTFILQESLGGNSKTMIIANVSPSICCASETLSTLKFAQRAKLIQNNAVVNEDASGDLCALQHQIRLLKEELSILKRSNVSRSLSFSSEDTDGDRRDTPKEIPEMAYRTADDPQRSTSLGTVRMSTKQLKSLETTLAGALRREQMADVAIKQLEAEIEQLNRLVRQREEDTQCTKMMLRFREDKIQRMESLIGGFMPSDSYLLEENNAVSEELQLLRARVDKNPEVTRFASENIRLLDKLRRFQDFYEEGEREILLKEVSGLRNQLLQFLNGNTEQYNYNHSNLNVSPKNAVLKSRENESFNFELKKAHEELDDCRNNLNSCLEINAKLTREINDLHSQLKNLKSVCHDQHADVEPIVGSKIEDEGFEICLLEEIQKEKVKWKHETIMKHTEEIMNLQLELDILKIILEEERSSHVKIVEKASCLSSDLEIAKEECLQIRIQLEDATNKLKETNSVIEALEGQQILSINELEDLREKNNHYFERLSKQEQEIAALKEPLFSRELKDTSCPSLEALDSEDSILQAKLKRMHDSLEKAKKLNMWYQGDRAFQASNEQEMDEVRRQVEAETAEVIVCLQEELTTLQQQVKDCNAKEIETKQNFLLLESQSKDLQEQLYLLSLDKEMLGQLLARNDEELRSSSEEWEKLALEIEEVMADGHEALIDASDQVELMSCSFPKKAWIREQVGRMIRNISEKELKIDELEKCLENAQNIRIDMDWKLRSLRGAALAITEVQQHESSEKEKEIIILTSLLDEKASIITELEHRIKIREEQVRKAEICAMVAFVIVNRLSEAKSVALKNRDAQFNETTELDFKKDATLQDHVAVIEEAEKQIQDLRIKLEGSEETCAKLNLKLVEADNHICDMDRRLEVFEQGVLLEAREKVDELKLDVSALNSCINKYVEKVGKSKIIQIPGQSTPICAHGDSQGLTEIETNTIHVEHLETGRICDTDATVLLLRKEIEFAVESLKETKSQIANLLKDQEEIQKSKKQSQESTECFTSQFLALQAEIRSSEELSDVKMGELVDKLQRMEEMTQEATTYWFQKKVVLESELSDAKEVAAQKSAEASLLLAKFEEAQETMNEADVMVNALMNAKETTKMDMERLKISEARLINERGLLINEVQSLRTSNEQKDQQYKNLERQLCSELSEVGNLVLSLENAFTQVWDSSDDEFKLMLCDLQLLKSQIQQSTNLTRSWLEDIWSEIIAKDCAVSVLHLCHMGVFLEAVTGLNAENGLLNHVLSESNSIISELKEHNSKAKRELHICKILKGKLLVDIKNSFDRVLGKEDETGKISAKLNSFEKKISDLQLQEELMLSRSSSMGLELSLLIKELDHSNKNAFAALSDQEKLLKDKEELVKSQVDFMTKDLIAKDFESFIFVSELRQKILQKADLERQQETFIAFLGNMEKELVFCMVEAEMEKLLSSDTDIEVVSLKKIVDKNDIDRSSLSEKLKQCSSRLAEVEQVNKALKCDIQSLKEDLLDITKNKERLMAEAQVHKTEMEQLTREWEIKERELGASICRLQEEMDRKDAELNKMRTVEEENNTIKDEVRNLKADYSRVFDDLQAKNLESEYSFNCMNAFDQEIHRLQEKVCSLENRIASLSADFDNKSRKVEELQCSQSVTAIELISKSKDLENQTKAINALKEENCSLRRNHVSLNQNKDEILSSLSLNFKRCLDIVQAVNTTGDNMFQILDMKNDTLLNKMVYETCENDKTASMLIAECESLEKLTEQIISENLSFKAEMLRKDEIMKGLLFDLSLLQESSSNAKDQKDDLERMVAEMLSLEDDLAIRSAELDKTSAHSEMLETQLKEKTELISALELDVSKNKESLKQTLEKNAELSAEMEDLLVAKSSLEEELMDRNKVIERLEEEIFQMDNALGQMNTALEGLQNDLIRVTDERDHLDSEVVVLREKIEITQALAEENEAVANEARQIAESSKTCAEEKEEEIKLLEKSVEELECTVNVLENKVDIVKGEAERQRLQREDLELELQAIKDQMLNSHTSAATMDLETKNAQSSESRDIDFLSRRVEEKENELQEARKQVKVLEKNIADKEAEISQCKVHISELNLHAEAQAREYKQKFKVLEAMAEQVKPDHVSYNVPYLSSSKQEKNPVKSRGSGSPFKCIGLGLVQQINSEKDEELTAGKLRIEELETLAASRQKEIFMLNTRLAAAESMTHDVIRDLLGVKLDMTNYASLFDHHQMQKLTEEARLNSKESIVKEQEVVKLKRQLNEFIEERQGWLEEINRRHANMVAARIASEKLRQRDQFLTAENEMLKKENINHKKKLMELEGEVNKLSGQQNIQQRIHHHAKIKEENNCLKTQNEDLSAKLRRSETILSRVKEELARYRASSGRGPSIDFEEEYRLNKKLRETEEERLQLAEKLLSLCTSILKAAGIPRPLPEINPSVAEEALEQLKARLATLEGELQDLSFKNKITSERIRLSELKQQSSSPLSSKTQEDCTGPFLRTLSR